MVARTTCLRKASLLRPVSSITTLFHRSPGRCQAKRSSPDCSVRRERRRRFCPVTSRKRFLSLSDMIWFEKRGDSNPEVPRGKDLRKLEHIINRFDNNRQLSAAISRQHSVDTLFFCNPIPDTGTLSNSIGGLYPSPLRGIMS